MSVVPQLLSADASLTGRENVELSARLFDVPRRLRGERRTTALAAMGLTDAADRIVKTYSGGMIRRLELAQALVSAPRLLVLDEPTVGLDPIARGDVWEYIARLRESFEMTVLMTTHYMDEADANCDQVALMHAGRIRACGRPAELKAALGEGASLLADRRTVQPGARQPGTVIAGLLIGTRAHLGLDAVVLVAATIAGVTASSLLLPRLASA